jgi:hypothetical protein
MSRISDRFKMDIPVKTLFEKPSIGLLAKHIEELVAAWAEGLSEEELVRAFD